MTSDEGLVITARGMMALKLMQTGKFTGLSDPDLHQAIERISTEGPATEEERGWLDEINRRINDAGQGE
jgi:hypothetical protein